MQGKDGVDRLGLHPFADERREVGKAEDTVGVGADDHARVADLRDDRRGSQPAAERAGVCAWHLEQEISG